MEVLWCPSVAQVLLSLVIFIFRTFEHFQRKWCFFFAFVNFLEPYLSLTLVSHLIFIFIFYFLFFFFLLLYGVYRIKKKNKNKDCLSYDLFNQFGSLSCFCWMAAVAIVQYLTIIKHYRFFCYLPCNTKTKKKKIN